MKTILAVYMLAYASCIQPTHAETDWEKAGRIISNEVRPRHVRELLADLSLVKPWTKKREYRILLGIDTDLGGICRSYRAVGYRSLKQFSFYGADRKGACENNFVVTAIAISDRFYYHMYGWVDGKYKMARVSKLRLASE